MQKGLLVLVLVLGLGSLLPQVAAVGISPSSLTIDYAPDLVRSYNITISNGQPEAMNVAVYLEGQYKDFFTINTKPFTLQPNGYREIILTIDTRGKSIRPGTQNILLGVLSDPVNIPPEGISARATIVMKIKLRVPYPDTYLDARLEAPNANVGSDVPLKVFLLNLGSKPLPPLKGMLEVSRDQEKVTTMPLEIPGLRPQEEREITKVLATKNLSRGDYHASVLIPYEGKTATAEADFRLGSFYVAVLNYTRRIDQGEINRFEIRVENQWDQPIPDIAATIGIGPEGNELTTIKTPGIYLESWNQGLLWTFVDATVLPEGTYPLLITLAYSNTSTIERGSITVAKQKVQFVWTTNMTLIVVIALLIFLDLLWVFRRRKHPAPELKPLQPPAQSQQETPVRPSP